MKITFKDVGQGDSILLEWTANGVDKIGIIDCNRKNKQNPIVEYLKNSTYNQIEFIVLSHPHSDHYSGFVELFSYIEKNNITVLDFYHSLFILGEEYFKYLHLVEIDTEAIELLKQIVEIAGNLRDNNIIKRINSVVENMRIDLTDTIYLKALSPSHFEAECYMEKMKYGGPSDKKKLSSAANYLSTLFKLVVADKYCLLTSDCEPETFTRIIADERHETFRAKTLFVGQLPHHGAEKNFVPEFWNFVNNQEERHAIISAGTNFKYKHPHFPVLKGIHEGGYKIHATNIVHGMEDFIEYLSNMVKTTTVLDSISDLVSDYSGGEKSFYL